MQQPYLLPREHHAIPLGALRRRNRSDNSSAALRPNDPAVSVMVDLERDSFLTVTEDTDLERALDGMFRLGVRLFLVVRASAVVGVLSIQDARRPRAGHESGNGAVSRSRVADAMIPCAQVPAIDWRVLHQCSIGDLAEIFAGSGAQYLVVLEDETPQCSRLRGLVARERLDRSLDLPQLD
jgi:CBS domain-containing protein